LGKPNNIPVLLHVGQLKLFLDINGYNLDDVCLAVQVLKGYQNSATHPNDPSTSPLDIQNAIDHLFPTKLHPKRIMVQKALEVLEILSRKLEELFFRKTD
jgi:hypothetical protein